KKVELSSTETTVLAVTTPAAARGTFCASGPGAPTHGLCVPRRLRRAVGQISAGERYQIGGAGSARRSAPAPRRRSANGGTPQGCQGALATHGFTPNQLATAYGVDPLHAQGLDGQGVRVDTLAAQIPRDIGLG